MNAYYQLVKREVEENGTQTAYYKPTRNTQGAWNDKEQHMGPATGVICAELEQFQPRENMRYGRISLDIFGMIHLEEFKVTTRCIRPGRTIALVESVFEAKGRTCVSARAWRMLTQDTRDIEGLEDEHVPFKKNLQNWEGMSVWPGGYIESIIDHIRVVERREGKGIVWLTNDLDMVDGQTTSSFVKLLGMVDTMNGVVVRQQGKVEDLDYIFPNLDLQIHLYRLPEGKWLGLEVQQQYGADGIGLTSAVLHDEMGPFGHAEQILTIRKK